MNWPTRGALGTERLAVISGGFDPPHRGHCVLAVEAAEKYGPGGLVVIVNSDEWLVRKKGRFFMERREREVLLSMWKPVVLVVTCDDRDGTVTHGLAELRRVNPRAPMTFCNGGDRGPGTVPEEDFCLSRGIDLAFGVGGSAKVQSSSLLLDRWEAGATRRNVV